MSFKVFARATQNSLAVVISHHLIRCVAWDAEVQTHDMTVQAFDLIVGPSAGRTTARNDFTIEP